MAVGEMVTMRGTIRHRLGTYCVPDHAAGLGQRHLIVPSPLPGEEVLWLPQVYPNSGVSQTALGIPDFTILTRATVTRMQREGHWSLT